MDTAYYLNLAFNGLVEGSIYALGALAITLVFGIARFPNASTGDLMTVGAFGGLAGTGSPEAIQQAQRNRTETRARRCAHFGLGDMCAQKRMNGSVF